MLSRLRPSRALRGWRRRLDDENGISLVETIVSIGILGVILTALAGSIVNSLRSIVASRHELAATAVGNEALEELRAVEYGVLGLCDPAYDGGTSSSLDPFEPTSDTLALGTPFYLPASSTTGVSCDASATTDELIAGGLVPVEEHKSRQGVTYTVRRHVLSGPDGDGDGEADYKELAVEVTWSSAAGERERTIRTVTAPSGGETGSCFDGSVEIAKVVPSQTPLLLEPVATPEDGDGDGVGDDEDGDGEVDEVIDKVTGAKVPTRDLVTGLPNLVTNVVDGTLEPAIDDATGRLLGLNHTFELSVTTCGLEFTDEVTVQVVQNQSCGVDDLLETVTCGDPQVVTLATQAGLTTDGRVWNFTFSANGMEIIEGVPLDFRVVARDVIDGDRDEYVETVEPTIEALDSGTQVAFKNVKVKHPDETNSRICVGPGNEMTKDLEITATVIGLPDRVQAEFLHGQSGKESATKQLTNSAPGVNDKTVEVKWELTLLTVDNWVFNPNGETVFAFTAQRADGSSDWYPPVSVPVEKC